MAKVVAAADSKIETIVAAGVLVNTKLRAVESAAREVASDRVATRASRKLAEKAAESAQENARRTEAAKSQVAGQVEDVMAINDETRNMMTPKKPRAPLAVLSPNNA